MAYIRWMNERNYYNDHAISKPHNKSHDANPKKILEVLKSRLKSSSHVFNRCLVIGLRLSGD